MIAPTTTTTTKTGDAAMTTTATDNLTARQAWHFARRHPDTKFAVAGLYVGAPAGQAEVNGKKLPMVTITQTVGTLGTAIRCEGRTADAVFVRVDNDDVRFWAIDADA